MEKGGEIGEGWIEGLRHWIEWIGEGREVDNIYFFFDCFSILGSFHSLFTF